MITAVTHIHTRHSWDSLIKPRDLVHRLKDAGVELALVTDHDSFEGSREVAVIAAREAPNLSVPLAAEIRTDLGDVVVVLKGSRIPQGDELKTWENLVARVRDLGGLIWLPHPFRGHRDPEELAGQADIIEVFNSRCSDSENDRAQQLCEQFSAIPAYGCDAHLLRESTNAVVEYEPASSAVETFLSPPHPVRLGRTKRTDKDLAEIVNGFKRRRVDLVGYFSVRFMRDKLTEWSGKSH